MGLEYYNFDKVLGELGMDEDELKRLVSEGQIRAFRDENRMKFRKDDIDQLRKGKQTEPTIILPEGALEEEGGDKDELFVVESDTEETILDLDGIGDSDFATDESSVPSLDFDDDLGGGNDTLTEELVFDEEDDLGMGHGTEDMDDFDDMGMEATQRIDSDAAFLDDDEFGMQTEPLGLEVDDDDADATMVDDGTLVDDDDFTEYDDVEEGDATQVSAPRPRREGRPAPRPAPAGPPAPAATRPVGLVWVILLGVVAGLYGLAAICMFDYSTSAPGISKMVGEQVSTQMFDQEWQDPDYRPEETVSRPEWLDQPGRDVEQGPQAVAGGGID